MNSINLFILINLLIMKIFEFKRWNIAHTFLSNIKHELNDFHLALFKLFHLTCVSIYSLEEKNTRTPTQIKCYLMNLATSQPIIISISLSFKNTICFETCDKVEKSKTRIANKLEYCVLLCSLYRLVLYSMCTVPESRNITAMLFYSTLTHIYQRTCVANETGKLLKRKNNNNNLPHNQKLLH